MATIPLSLSRPARLLGGRLRIARTPRQGTIALVAGLTILIPIVFLAVIYPVLPLPGPTAPDPLNSLQGPSLHHLFGTDRIGRDVFVRTIAGARISLTVGLGAAVCSVGLGIVLGTLSGFLGRWLDGAIMAVTNVLLSFPSLLLAVALVAAFGAGLWQLIVAITIADAPRALRMQRSMVLSLKSRTYVDAARMAAAPTHRILLRHIIPNSLTPMVVVTSIYAATAIVVESSLSFMGLGIVPPTPSWGNLVADGRPFLRDGWWISTFPGVAIIVVSIALHLLADGLRHRMSVSA